MKKVFFLAFAILQMSFVCYAQDSKNAAKLYNKEQLTAINGFVKKLKATKQFKSVSLYCPEYASHVYFMVTKQNGQIGLIYDKCADKAGDAGTDSQVMMIPTSYTSFEYHRKYGNDEPYLAYNKLGTGERNIYYYHSQDNDIIIAYGASTDVYSISHEGGKLSCKRIITGLTAPIMTIPGFIVTGAQQKFVSDDENERYYYFASLTNRNMSVRMYDMNGNLIVDPQYKVYMACFSYEEKPTGRTNKVMYKTWNGKMGSALVGRGINQSCPGIFAGAEWNEDRTCLIVYCSAFSGPEIYDPSQSYIEKVKDPTSTVFPFIIKGKMEEGLKTYQAIPKDERTAEDMLCAALACYNKASADQKSLSSNLTLLKNNLGSKIVDIPDFNVTSLAINTCLSLSENAGALEPERFGNTCKNLALNTLMLEETINADKEKFYGLYQQKVKKQQSAQFWGNLLVSIANCSAEGVANTAAGAETKVGAQGTPGWAKARFDQLEKEIESITKLIPTLEGEEQRTAQTKLERYIRERDDLKHEYVF